MGSSEDELIQLRNKYELSEKNLRCLMTLGSRAAEDYETLNKMYNENQKQYENLKIRLQDTEAELMKLQKALMPACEEYNQLNRHFQIEQACRTKLETIATEVTRENKKLKHQSQVLIGKLGETKCDLTFLATISDESEASETSSICSSGEQTVLNEKISSLQEDVGVLQQKLQSAEEEKEAALKSEADLKLKIKKLEAELLKACKTINNHDQMVESFKRSSMLAIGEFSHLQNAYDTQVLLNQKAEEYAHEMLVQRDAVVRQSSILMNSAFSDARVHQALIEIEKVTKELETVKREDQEKIKALEERISSSEDVQKVMTLETELEIASNEVTRLHRAVQELEEWKQTTLEDKIRSKPEETEDILCPPPPPPPPPPPACPPPFLGPKLFVVKAKPSVSAVSPSAASNPASPKPPIVDAMSEMMARIKSGNVQLKRNATTVKVIPKPEPPKAMRELENILKNISVKRADDGVSRRPSKPSIPPPVMNKPLKQPSQRKPTEVPVSSQPVSELERKMSNMKERTAQRTATVRTTGNADDSLTSQKSENTPPGSYL